MSHNIDLQVTTAYYARMTKRLTNKQTVFVKAIAEGKNGTQAALEAYDTDSIDVAKSIASENLTKPYIQEALAPVYKKLDITIEKALKPVALALEAKTKHKIGEVITEYDEQGRATQKEYIYADEDNIPLQLQGSDRAIKLLGIDKQIEHDTSIGEYTTEELEALASSADEVTLTQLVFKRVQG